MTIKYSIFRTLLIATISFMLSSLLIPSQLRTQTQPTYHVDTIMTCIEERFIFQVTLEDLGTAASLLIVLDYADTVARNINSLPFVYEHPDTFNFGDLVEFEILDEANPANAPIEDYLDLFSIDCPTIEVNLLTQEDCANEELTFSVHIDKVPKLDSRKIIIDGITVVTDINTFPFTYQHPTVYPKNATVNVQVLDEADPSYQPVNQLVNTEMYYCPRTIVCGDTTLMNYCYTRYDNSEFLFTSDDNSTALQFRFLQGYSYSYDLLLTIYDGNTDSAPIIFQGDFGDDEVEGLIMRSSGSSMLLKAHTGEFESCTLDEEPPWIWEVTCYTPEAISCGNVVNDSYCYNPSTISQVFTYQSSDPSNRLQLKFTENELSTFQDFVVYDGPTRTSPILYNNNGLDPNSIHQQLVSSGDFLFVEIYYFGLAECTASGDPPVQWEVDCFVPETVTCGNTLTDSYCYDYNERHAFWYEAADDTGPLSIEFNSGYLEVNWGIITIYDGVDTTANILYTGDNNGDLTNLKVTGTSENLLLVLDVEYQSRTCASHGETEMDWEISCHIPQPSAICRTDTLMLAALTVLHIDSINNGSFDPAGLNFDISFTLNIPDDTLRTISCLPLGYQTIKIYAWNEAGGIDSCESIIYVEEIELPILTGCNEYHLNCGDDYSVGTLGMPVFSDNCDVNHTLSYTDLQVECGTVLRTWRAIGIPSNDTIYCAETIYRADNFTESSITWPRDTTIDACLADLENLPANYQYPKLLDTFCTELFIDFQQDTIYNGAYCIELQRNWSISDTCGLDELFTHTQYLRIDNPPAHPILSNCDTILFCKEEFHNCDEVFLYHFLNFNEICDSFPKHFRLQIDWDNDGNFEEDRQASSYAEPAPYGIHRFKWTVAGFCGSESICEEIIKIEDCNGDCSSGGIPDTLLITNSQNIMTGDTLQACDYIEASNFLPASLQEVTYKAACIRLLPGFSTEHGLDFHAYIEGCDQQLQSPPTANQRNKIQLQEEKEVSETLLIFPNPFQQETTLQYTINKPGKVQINVYSIAGQLVKNWEINSQQKGMHQFKINGNYWQPGVYLVTLQMEGMIKRGKFTKITGL